MRAAYRCRDAALIAEKKDFGSALQNLYRELERRRKYGWTFVADFFASNRSCTYRGCSKSLPTVKRSSPSGQTAVITPSPKTMAA
jgi:hypothetical protein